MVYVGKQAGYHTATQTEIHAMLCQFAEEGNTVVRLKGGDPFIFGRGGEEMQYLEERGINVHTIPGAAVTAIVRAPQCCAHHVLCMCMSLRLPEWVVCSLHARFPIADVMLQASQRERASVRSSASP